MGAHEVFALGEEGPLQLFLRLGFGLFRPVLVGYGQVALGTQRLVQGHGDRQEGPQQQHAHHQPGDRQRALVPSG